MLHIFSDGSNSKSTVRKKGKSENPFSFKKFLSGSNSKDGDGRNPVQQQNHDRLAPSVSQPNSLHTVNHTSGRHSVPNLHVAGDLPDFVQDHYSESMGTSPRGIELPDFTIRDITENGPDLHSRNVPLSQFSTAGVSDSLPLRQSDPDDDFDEISDSEDNIVTPQANLVHSLPDFLSDAAVSSSLNSESVADDSIGVSRHSRLQDSHISHNPENQRVGHIHILLYSSRAWEFMLNIFLD